MSTQISVRPLNERPAFQSAQEARRRHEREYEVTVSVMDLPSAHVAYEATSSEVYVFATDMNVLAAWLYAMGGTAAKQELGTGVTVWTLRTQTYADPGEVACPVLVSVSVVSGSSVMCEIAAAVAR